VHEVAEEVWACAVEGGSLSLEQRGRIRAAAVWAVDQAAAATRAAFTAGGGTSVYSCCPLQRRLRDIEALHQHFLVKRDTLTAAGGALLGQAPAVPVF
jgi:hypothetical protein